MARLIKKDGGLLPLGNIPGPSGSAGTDAVLPQEVTEQELTNGNVTAARTLPLNLIKQHIINSFSDIENQLDEILGE